MAMKPPDNYPSLLKKVKTTLIEGQARIEAERIFTYWETGRIILAYILKNKSRGEYGEHVLRRLAKDLNMDISTLKRCVQFARTYPKLPNGARGRQFKWSHFRRLITVADDTKRLSFEKAVLDKGWTAEELGERLKEDPSRQRVPISLPSPKLKADSRELLAPLRGQLFTYQLVERPTVGGEPELLVDLGFGTFLDIPPQARLAKGDFIDGNFKKKDATAKDLYTYAAYIEKIIDADTLKVRIDLGFSIWSRQVLRLRGIDCPEMSTKEGQAAKAFIQSYIKEADTIIMRSSRSDKYDRYLADVFISASEGEIFLNNFLLEKKHAVRWG